ncbi:MAG: hypothetical protein JNN28_11910 [Saprospiraceae bacterium]|nr:hypothetical protein [Saprospiraceae bacterium]
MHNYTLRQTIPTLLLLLLPCMLYGQKYALAIDSLTKAHISRLPKSKQIKFDSLLAQRLAFNLLHRIDSLPFDYAFIEEEFCYMENFGSITERYFSGGDTIPRHVFEDGAFLDPKEVYNDFFIWYSKYVSSHYTLQPLLKSYSKLKATQVLAYDKIQIWEHGCVIVANSEAAFKQIREEELKATYRIMTLIDRQLNKVILSVQVAPKKPRFQIFSYNPVWDW